MASRPRLTSIPDAGAKLTQLNGLRCPPILPCFIPAPASRWLNLIDGVGMRAGLGPRCSDSIYHVQTNLFQQWFSDPRRDIVAGAVVALALIPEAIAFSIIAGLDPKVGRYASFCISVVIAFTGARPGMVALWALGPSCRDGGFNPR